MLRYHYSHLSDAECCYPKNVVLNIVMLHVIYAECSIFIGMLSDVVPSVDILKVIVLNIVMLHINFLSIAYAECSILLIC